MAVKKVSGVCSRLYTIDLTSVPFNAVSYPDGGTRTLGLTW